MADIRLPAVSGTFYPGNPDVLRKDIEGYFSKARVDRIPDSATVKGIISPHAGYMYSGQTAAYGYKALAGSRYDTVIIVAPSHRSFFAGAALDNRRLYRTPLGDIPIDQELTEELLGESGVMHANPKVHEGEHSLEVQLPFLQFVLKSFTIVPVIMGTQDPQSSEDLSNALSDCLGKKGKRFLVVGSTDLSHYYPYDYAVQLDSVVVRHLEGFDIEGMLKDLTTEQYEACGAGPMITVMMVSRQLGADRGKVLNYANSGDVSGDRSSVVGYVSAVFYGGE